MDKVALINGILAFLGNVVNKYDLIYNGCSTGLTSHGVEWRANSFRMTNHWYCVDVVLFDNDIILSCTRRRFHKNILGTFFRCIACLFSIINYNNMRLTWNDHWEIAGFSKAHYVFEYEDPSFLTKLRVFCENPRLIFHDERAITEKSPNYSFIEKRELMHWQSHF